MNHQENRVRSLVFGVLASGRVILAVGSEDGMIRLWDPAAAAEIGAPLQAHDGWVRSLAFGELDDGRVVLASSGEDGVIRLWAPAAATAIGAPLHGHQGYVSCVAFGRLADGRIVVASAGNDRTIRLWDPGTASAIGTPLATFAEVQALAFRGDAIAAATDSGIVVLDIGAMQVPAGLTLEERGTLQADVTGGRIAEA